MRDDLLASALFAGFVLSAGAACDGTDGTDGTGAAGGGGSTSASGGGGSTSGTGGCGGGCLEPGQCMDTSDCEADAYCARPEDCYGIGVCAPKSDACSGAETAVCGCDGTTYASRCDAAAAGESAHVSLTECSEPPQGQFPCGTGYCNLGESYCREEAGVVGCAPLPDACTGTPDCSCLAGNVDCSVCYPTKAGGTLALGCSG